MKIVNESLNENMGYRTILGEEISHNDALQKNIRDLITQIIVNVRGISEKAFSDYDNVMNEVKNVCDKNPDIYKRTQEFYDQKRRLNLLAEEIYEKYF